MSEEEDLDAEDLALDGSVQSQNLGLLMRARQLLSSGGTGIIRDCVGRIVAKVVSPDQDLALRRASARLVL